MAVRLAALSLCGAIVLAWPAAALAQDAYQSAQTEIAGALAEIEGNLIEKEGIEMNFADWQAKIDGFKPRIDDLSRRYDETNAYCQGTFEEPEYTQRLNYCTSMFSQLDTLKAQLQPEADALDAQFATLQDRDTRRQAAGSDLGERLAAGVQRLVLACIDLPPENQKALCHLPPAPGPRTLDLVTQINADLAGDY